jgi:hypothetical protein
MVNRESESMTRATIAVAITGSIAIAAGLFVLITSHAKLTPDEEKHYLFLKASDLFCAAPGVLLLILAWFMARGHALACIAAMLLAIGLELDAVLRLAVMFADGHYPGDDRAWGELAVAVPGIYLLLMCAVALPDAWDRWQEDARERNPLRMLKAGRGFEPLLLAPADPLRAPNDMVLPPRPRIISQAKSRVGDRGQRRNVPLPGSVASAADEQIRPSIPLEQDSLSSPND